MIRSARASDTAALGRLGALLVKTHHDFDRERFLPPTEGTEKGYGSWLGSQLKKKEVVVLVAEQGSAVIGYAYAGLEGIDYMALRGPAGALYDILVEPSYRGRGVGRQLLDAVIGELKSRGAPRVVLSTATRNEPARKLFAAAGFRETMIEMTKEL